MSETAPRRSLPDPDPGSVANALYVVWAAIGLSILGEFALLLYLQRAGQLRIEDVGGPWSPAAHLTLALTLAAGALLILRTLRARLRDPASLRRGIRAEAAARAPASDRAAASDRLSLRPRSVVPSAARAVAIRFVGLSVLQWAVADALALAGLTVAFVLQPAPRSALILYFTLALALWVWYRPAAAALIEALKGASRSV